MPVRSVRLPRERLRLAQERAYADGVTLSNALNTYLLAYASGTTVPQIAAPVPSKDSVTFTWRAPDSIWSYFRSRIEAEESHAIGAVLNGFLEAYGRGHVSTSGKPLAEVGR
jgi:hypothetical protein